MTVYVYRDGQLVEKTSRGQAPAYRFTEYESPVNGALITSPRQRERDLNRSDSVDPRDFGRDHNWKRGREVQAKEAALERSRPQQQLDFWR
jgi:hypothetical protein